ncbi:MAG: BamA/TamA family outer membrane protein, partial [Candidatus Krumholzibacteriia bacterium]
GQTQWLTEDGRWLGALPPAARLALPPEADQAPPDDATDRAAWVALVRAAVARAAAGAVADSAVAVRPLQARLRDRWLARGHLQAQVLRRPGAAAAADAGVPPDTLVVAPGPAWTWAGLEVAGEDFPGREHLLGTWLPRAGDRFDAYDLDEGIDRVLTGAGEAGRPFARWVTREIQLDAGLRTVTLAGTLLPGYPAWLGPITTSLPPGRASAFAARTAGLESGAPFRQSDLARAVDRLLARDLYARVDEPIVHVTAAVDTVGVHLPIVPRPKANRAQVVLGLSRREEGGSRLSGQVDLDLPNLAGTGRALAVGWRDDGDRTSRFGFRYLEPLAFGTALDTDLALDHEVQQDAYTRFRVDNRWRLPVVALWGVEVGLGWDRATYPLGALERSTRTRVRGAVLHRRGDRSRSGWEGSFAVEEAWRQSIARTDTVAGVPQAPARLGEATNQRIFEADTAGELWLGEGLSVFVRSSFREVSGTRGEVPLSEQFRFGGAASLRGYREEEFHGERAAWGAVELRLGSARGSRLYTFYDLGYFAFEAADPTPADPGRRSRREGWPRGYGLGILARTPGGDLSLAVGFPGTVDFDQAKLHVTLMESF